MTELTFIILNTAVTGLLLVFGRFLWRRFEEFRNLPQPTPVDAGPDAPLVAVIVPARNEARNIHQCLTALLNQSYPNFRVIAVDDQSTDETPQIIAELSAADPRLRGVQAQPLQPGWMGKCNALWSGVQHATDADWLVFVDADTFAEPGLLAATIPFAEAEGYTIVSPLPRQILEGFAERMIQPVVFGILQIFLPPARANDPNDPMGHVAGQCLAIRRDAYFALGGHSHPTVRGAISEDTAIGRLYKAAGHRLAITDGREVVYTHMYTDFGEIWQGWSKNFFPGLYERWALLPISVLSGYGIVLYFAVVIVLGALLGLPLWLQLWPWVLLAGLLAWLTVMRYIIGAILGFRDWMVLTWVPGLLIVSAIATASLLRHVSGRGATWKGRTVHEGATADTGN